MRKGGAIALAAAAFGLLALGCGEELKGPRGTPGNPWVIGVTQCGEAEPRGRQLEKDIRDAARKHPEIKVTFRGAGNDAALQETHLRGLIADRPDAIIVLPKAPEALTQAIGEAFDKKIPVIVLERKPSGDKYTCLLETNDSTLGEMAGKQLARLIEGKGKVVELQGPAASDNARERHDGFMRGIQGSEIENMFDADCAWLEAEAEREMGLALGRFDRIDGVFAHNDVMAKGAWLAARAEGRGRQATTRFVGIGALPAEGIQYVRDGMLAATIEWPTGGREALEAALKILGGERVPKSILLRIRVFTAANVDKGGEAIDQPVPPPASGGQ